MTNAFLIFSAASFLLSKKAFDIASLIVDSCTPILKSPISVLIRYFASIGLADVKSSVINEIFFEIGRVHFHRPFAGFYRAGSIRGRAGVEGGPRRLRARPT